MKFISSLLSKKLAFAAAAEMLVHSLHMTADQKGICTAVIAIGFLAAQSYVDANEAKAATPAPTVELKVNSVAPPPGDVQ